MADDVTREVLAAEERRCAAIAAEDWAALMEANALAINLPTLVISKPAMGERGLAPT